MFSGIGFLLIEYFECEMLLFVVIRFSWLCWRLVLLLSELWCWIFFMSG